MKKIVEEKVITEKVRKNIDELAAEGLLVNGNLKEGAELFKEVQRIKKTVWYVIEEKKCLK